MQLNRWLPRRAPAGFGALGLLGVGAGAVAAPSPRRSALDARVADMRRHLI